MIVHDMSLLIMTNHHPTGRGTLTLYFFADGSISLEEQDPSRHETQSWALADNKILNRYDQATCVEIEGGSTEEGTQLVAGSYSGADSQQWLRQPL